jgi:hypothetical protein
MGDHELVGEDDDEDEDDDDEEDDENDGDLYQFNLDDDEDGGFEQPSPSRAAAAAGEMPAPVTPRIHSLSDADDILEPDSIYVVVLQKGKHGLCLNLAGVSLVRVVSFRPLPTGEPGPAEASRKINVGDVLLGVDGTAVNKLRDVMELLGESGNRVELRFQKADVISQQAPLPPTLSTSPVMQAHSQHQTSPMVMSPIYDGSSPTAPPSPISGSRRKQISQLQQQVAALQEQLRGSNEALKQSKQEAHEKGEQLATAKDEIEAMQV